MSGGGVPQATNDQRLLRELLEEPQAVGTDRSAAQCAVSGNDARKTTGTTG